MKILTFIFCLITSFLSFFFFHLDIPPDCLQKSISVSINLFTPSDFIVHTSDLCVIITVLKIFLTCFLICQSYQYHLLFQYKLLSIDLISLSCLPPCVTLTPQYLHSSVCLIVFIPSSSVKSRFVSAIKICIVLFLFT